MSFCLENSEANHNNYQHTNYRYLYNPKNIVIDSNGHNRIVYCVVLIKKIR